MAEQQRKQPLALVCRVTTFLLGVPLEHIVETMRPMTIQSVSGVPSFVQGVAIIRGKPVPVVDGGQLLGAGMARPSRWVTMRVGYRQVALAVDSILGIIGLSAESLHQMPPLLRTANTEVVSGIEALDSEFLFVLRSARLVPEDMWRQLGVEGVSS